MVGDKAKVTNAKGEVFDCIICSEVYYKDMSHHYGNQRGEIVLDFIKVRRFIKSKDDYAVTPTEYRAFQVG